MKKDTLPPWDVIRKYPIEMFHTAGGPPMMGHVGEHTKKGFRLWAPAQVVMPGPTAVAFLPMPFVEYYIDLYWVGLRANNPVQDAIIQGYEGFFKEFIKDAYLMKPLVIPMGIDAPGGEKTVDVNPAAPVLQPCPACCQELSNWQAHYPVLVPDDAGGKWICEMSAPDVREKYPNYAPPIPFNQQN